MEDNQIKPVVIGKASNMVRILLVVVALLLLIIGVFAGYFLFQYKNKPVDSKPVVIETPVVEEPVVHEPVLDDETKVVGDVQWQEPKEIKDFGFFVDGIDPEYFVVGKFVSGKYKDADLILAFVTSGMGGRNESFYFVNDNSGQIVALVKNIDVFPFEDGMVLKQYSSDKDYNLNIDLGIEKFVDSGTGHAFKKEISPWGWNTFFFEKEEQVKEQGTSLRKIFNYGPLGDVYMEESKKTSADDYGSDAPIYMNYILTGTHGFYAKSVDGLMLSYSLEPFFMDNGVPRIQWTDTIGMNTDEYIYANQGGCGFRDFAAVMNLEKINIAKDLVEAGTVYSYDSLNQNGVVYMFADENHPFLKSFYEDALFTFEDEEKISYADFIASRPFFFWQDKFGRLIKFQKSDYLSPAECGKPVIYLYPEKTTEVSVKVAPVGGFSYTDPEYNDGWLVKAEPNGQLTEISSGKNYPYLFWEGRGGLYQTPKKGWVVEKAEVENFLYQKLAELGLNKQESADFMEFWYPKMQSAPYYFITFMGNNVMNALAPLSIEPKADTTIRILMDYVELQAPIEVEPLNIRTPERRGFTVVEWGGVLR